MAVLVVILIAMQFFTVKPDEQALVLRFGKIRGIGEGRLLQPGPHWAMVPLDEVIRIPVKKVQMMPIDTFWYFQTEEEKLAGQKFIRPHNAESSYGWLLPYKKRYNRRRKRQ